MVLFLLYEDIKFVGIMPSQVGDLITSGSGTKEENGLKNINQHIHLNGPWKGTIACYTCSCWH